MLFFGLTVCRARGTCSDRALPQSSAELVAVCRSCLGCGSLCFKAVAWISPENFLGSEVYRPPPPALLLPPVLGGGDLTPIDELEAGSWDAAGAADGPCRLGVCGLGFRGGFLRVSADGNLGLRLRLDRKAHAFWGWCLGMMSPDLGQRATHHIGDAEIFYSSSSSSPAIRGLGSDASSVRPETGRCRKHTERASGFSG